MYINLGCGNLFSVDKKWKNFDLTSHHEAVIKSNFIFGIQVDSNVAEFVYSSHLLEHLPIDFAPQFLQENHRVLKPGGIIRIVVPDLEAIVNLYIKYREKLNDADPDKIKYEWMLIELFDQLSRNYSGGKMGEILKDKHSTHHEFAASRMGNVANDTIHTATSKILNLNDKFTQKCKNLHYKLIKLMLSKEQFEAMEMGQFRLSGECHQWMYDKQYLKCLLVSQGFTNIKVQSAKTSYLDDWQAYNLDHNTNGEAYKPGSLYIEAIKPG